MDTLSCYPLEPGSFDDEYHQFQTSVDHGYQINSDSASYFDGVSHVDDLLFEESYTSNPYPFEQTSYPSCPTNASITGPPSSTNTASSVEEFQYINFDESFMTEPQASVNVLCPPVGVEGRNELYYPPLLQQSSASSSSPAPKDKKPSKNGKHTRPPHARNVSHKTNFSSYDASPREGRNVAEPSSNVNCRPTKKSKGPPKSLLTVFDSNIEPNGRRKARSAFTDEGKKKVEAVRRVGACTECRFRKRTCGTSQPCHACIKRSGSTKMAATICIRESPFNDLSVTEFYGSSSRTRVIDFNVDITKASGSRRIFTIDGKGPSSRPLHVIVVEVETSSLTRGMMDEVRRVQSLRSPPSIEGSQQPAAPKTIAIIDPDVLSTLDLEKWAMEYAYKFTKTHNIHAAAFPLGVEYAQRKLPHSSLVANMMKVTALNYVLIHGIKVTPDDSSPIDAWRVLRAQIDTKLYQCLYRAEKLVYQALNKLIFLSAGHLTRDAIFPVSLTMWMLVRIQGARASFLSNMRPKTSASPILSSSGRVTTSVSHQDHVFNLLLTTFSTLFRSSLPLLLNFDESFNKDLLGGDAELLAMATKMKRSLLWFREFGYVKAHRKSIGYSKEHSRKVQELVKGR